MWGSGSAPRQSSPRPPWLCKAQPCPRLHPQAGQAAPCTHAPGRALLTSVEQARAVPVAGAGEGAGGDAGVPSALCRQPQALVCGGGSGSVPLWVTVWPLPCRARHIPVHRWPGAGLAGFPPAPAVLSSGLLPPSSFPCPCPGSPSAPRAVLLCSVTQDPGTQHKAQSSPSQGPGLQTALLLRLSSGWAFSIFFFFSFPFSSNGFHPICPELSSCRF